MDHNVKNIYSFSENMTTEKDEEEEKRLEEKLRHLENDAGEDRMAARGDTQFHCCRTPRWSLIKVNLYSCILVLVVDLAAKIDVSRIDRFQSVSFVKRYPKEWITCVCSENKIWRCISSRNVGKVLSMLLP